MKLKPGDICQILEGDSNTKMSRSHRLIPEVGELVAIKEIRQGKDYPVIVVYSKNKQYFCKEKELKLLGGSDRDDNRKY